MCRRFESFYPDMELKCRVCLKKKDEQEFHFRNKLKNIRHNICKSCSRDKRGKYYQRNRSKYILLSKVNGLKRLSIVHDLYWAYLLNHPCKCGQSNPLVLEPDHQRDKEFNISFMLANGWSWESILKELSKCIIMCRNCHQIKTHKERNSWRYRKYKSR